MSTPLPGVHIFAVEDTYNFYLSQLRITIERAFGILVHHWAVLRRPLSMSALKVPAILTCLMKLHNFCIDEDSRRTPGTLKIDERQIQRVATRNTSRKNQKAGVPSAVAFDEAGRPVSLVGSGHHFRDEPGGRDKRPPARNDSRTPMRTMIQQVADQDLRRPKIN